MKMGNKFPERIMHFVPRNFARSRVFLISRLCLSFFVKFLSSAKRSRGSFQRTETWDYRTYILNNLISRIYMPFHAVFHAVMTFLFLFVVSFKIISRTRN